VISEYKFDSSCHVKQSWLSALQCELLTAPAGRQFLHGCFRATYLSGVEDFILSLSTNIPFSTGHWYSNYSFYWMSGDKEVEMWREIGQLEPLHSLRALLSRPATFTKHCGLPDLQWVNLALWTVPIWCLFPEFCVHNYIQSYKYIAIIFRLDN
jgi:hypothetical protein